MVAAKSVDSQIGKHIKSAREAKSWSQNELAKRLGEKKIRVYGSTIAKIEAGDRWVKAAELVALADLFEISTDRLLGRDRQADADRAQAALVVADTAARAAAAAADHSEKLHQRALELIEAADKLPHHDALADGCAESGRQLLAAYDTLAEVGRIARGIIHDELKRAGLE